MKLYFDSLTTLKVIHAESPIVIFFGTYGTCIYCNLLYLCILSCQSFVLISHYCLLQIVIFLKNEMQKINQTELN